MFILFLIEFIGKVKFKKKVNNGYSIRKLDNKVLENFIVF